MQVNLVRGNTALMSIKAKSVYGQFNQIDQAIALL